MYARLLSAKFLLHQYAPKFLKKSKSKNRRPFWRPWKHSFYRKPTTLISKTSTEAAPKTMEYA